MERSERLVNRVMRTLRITAVAAALLAGPALVGCGAQQPEGAGGADPARDPATASPSAAPASPATATVAPPSVPARAVDAFEARRIAELIDQQYLRADVRQTFRTRFGEDVDCVADDAQPGARALGAGQRRDAEMHIPRAGLAPSASAAPELEGALDESGRLPVCPPDSVPIVRLRPEQIAAAGGVDAWRARAGSKGALGAPSPPAVPGDSSFAYAFGQINVGLGEVRGASTTLSVYAPTISTGAVHSLSQIWLSTQPLGGTQMTFPCSAPNCLQTLEAGVNVDKLLYHDNGAAHLFAYGTADGYSHTGCYNLTQSCSINGRSSTGTGFQMLSGARYTPGQTLTAGASGQAPPEVVIQWLTGGPGVPYWYLFVNGNAVGFIPYSFFRNGQGGNWPLSTGFTSSFVFGGEVADSTFRSQMGSGQFARMGFKKAAYQRNAFYYLDSFDGTGDFLIGSGFPLLGQTNTAYYTADSSTQAGGSGWGMFIYFGGPGFPGG